MTVSFTVVLLGWLTAVGVVCITEAVDVAVGAVGCTDFYFLTFVLLLLVYFFKGLSFSQGIHVGLGYIGTIQILYYGSVNTMRRS